MARSRWLLLAAAVVWALLMQGSRGLWEPDEGRYTDVAVEMVSTGRWVEPALNHETAHWTKPPLTYWAIAGSIGLLGRTEWAARLPSALAYAGALLVIAAFGRRLGAGEVWPTAVYASLVLPWAAANVVSTDTLLAFWELLGMFAFWRALESSRPLAWSGLAGASFGAAFLTKGPPGLLPLLAVGTFVALLRHPRATRGPAWIGAAACAAVALPWFLVVIARHPDLLGYFVGQEVVARVATATHGRNPEWYGAVKVYLPTLLVGLLPWSPWLATRAWRRRRELLSLGRWRDRLRCDPAPVLLALWFVIPLLVLALARSRLPLYVLPLTAPAALLVARHGPRPGPRLRLVLAAWLMLLVGLRGAAARYPSSNDSRAFADRVAETLPFLPSELVFVGLRPRWGVSFYLDTEVEGVELTAPAGTPSLSQELAEEEPNERRVFVLRDRDLEAAENLPGRPWETLARSDSLVFVRFPSSAAERSPTLPRPEPPQTQVRTPIQPHQAR